MLNLLARRFAPLSCLLPAAMIVALIFSLTGCGGSSHSATPVTPIAVAVAAPAGSSIFAVTGTALSLTAAVTNDSASAGVTWSVTPVSGSCPDGKAGNVTSNGSTAATYLPDPSLTANCSVTITATSVTDTTKSGSTTIIAQPYSANANTGLMYGDYACYYQGYKDDGSPIAMMWNMKANCTVGTDGACSAGYIKGGVLDYNNIGPLGLATTLATPATITASSACTGTNCYTLGSDMRGTLKFAYAGGSNSFAIAAGDWQSVSSQAAHKTLATELRLTRSDDSSGGYGSGHCIREQQDLISTTNAAGSFDNIYGGQYWVFGLNGVNSSYQPEVAGGLFSASGTSSNTSPYNCSICTISSPPSPSIGIDLVSGGTAQSGAAFTGTFQTDTNTTKNNRFQITFTGMPANLPSTWALRQIDSYRAVMISLDPVATKGLLVGQLRMQQQSSYSAASNLNSSFVAYETGAKVNSTTGATQGHFTNLMQGKGDGAGNITIQASTVNQDGAAGSSSNGTYSASVDTTTGRVTLGGAGSYLYLFDNQQGILLDGMAGGGSQNVGLGFLEAQTANPTLSSTMVQCTAPSPSPGVPPCTEPLATLPYFTGSMFSFDPSIASASGVAFVDASGNINLTQDFASLGSTTSKSFTGLLTDWTSAGWPSSIWGTFQIDQGTTPQMDCAVVSNATSPTVNFPNGRVICANAPGETLGVPSPGKPSITILQQ